MRYEIHPRLSVGDEMECPWNGPAFGIQATVLHACKHPCFVRANADTPLTPDDPHYLSIERTPDLYLNLIDPPAPLFKLRSFTVAMEWLDRVMADRSKPNVLIHCNSGVSRSPSLALLWLARHRFIVSDTFQKARASYDRLAIEAARSELHGVTPYAPGLGITIFLEEHWKGIVP